VSVNRNQLKNALRASIESEDDALKQRKPATASRRKAAVKSAIKVARQSAGVGTSETPAGKPVEMAFSRSEAALIKQVRDRLKAEGVNASKAEVIRLAVMMLQEAPTELLADALQALPKLKPVQD